MKKLFIAILAVAGLAACSQDMTLETPKGAAIAFDNAFVNNSTRIATDITVDNLQDFGVYGSVVNNQGQQGLIFNNQEVINVVSQVMPNADQNDALMKVYGAVSMYPGIKIGMKIAIDLASMM